MEGMNLALLVLDQKEVEAGHLQAREATGLRKMRTVHGHEPVLSEDGSLLQVEKDRLVVPTGRLVAFGDLEHLSRGKE